MPLPRLPSRRRWDNKHRSDARASCARPLPIGGPLLVSATQRPLVAPGKPSSTNNKAPNDPQTENIEKGGYKASKMGAGRECGKWRDGRLGEREKKEKEWEERTHKVIEGNKGERDEEPCTDRMLIYREKNQWLMLHTANNEGSSFRRV
jgi:hypothetical protein